MNVSFVLIAQNPDPPSASGMASLTDPAVLFPMLVQVVLAVIAGWYAIETRRLRIQGAAQAEVLRRQHFLAVAPYLLVGTMPKSQLTFLLQHHRELFEPTADPKQFEDELKRIQADREDFFIVDVSNPTSRLARSVIAVVYCAVNKHYVAVETGREVVAERDRTLLVARGPRYDLNGAVGHLRQLASAVSAKQLTKLLQPRPTSFLVVFYRDIEGGPYAITRSFQHASDGTFGQMQSEFELLGEGEG